jgi:ribonuclease BN (tRNA processing enzyme)
VSEAGEFIVLGCRAGSPGEGVAASGYLVRNKGRTILLDCGPGVVLELTRRGLAYTLDAAIITHAHADHCADLVALAYHRLFPTVQAPLPLWGSKPVERILRGLDEIFGIPSLSMLAAPLSRAFTFHPIAAGVPFDVAGLTVEAIAAVHPTPTFAVRFPELGLVYTADGALTDALVAFAQSAMLLVAECTYVDAHGHDLDGHGHMTAAQAGQLAARANARRLLLTHFSKYADAQRSARVAAAHFGGSIHVAQPGGRWQL